MENAVIAQRNKKIYIFPLAAGVLFLALGILFAVKVSVWFAFLAAAGAALLCRAVYDLALPRDAIVKNGLYLTFSYLFTKKTVAIKSVEYASCTERGEYYHRRNSLFSDVLYFTDTRRVTVTYKEGVFTKQISVFVRDASAVTAAIGALLPAKQDKR